MAILMRIALLIGNTWHYFGEAADDLFSEGASHYIDHHSPITVCARRTDNRFLHYTDLDLSERAEIFPILYIYVI